jgi:hypothetical protein
MAALAQSDREARSAAYRPAPAEDTRTHETEIMASHASSTVAGATPASGEGHGPWPRRPI